MENAVNSLWCRWNFDFFINFLWKFLMLLWKTAWNLCALWSLRLKRRERELSRLQRFNAEYRISSFIDCIMLNSRKNGHDIGSSTVLYKIFSQMSCWEKYTLFCFIKSYFSVKISISVHFSSFISFSSFLFLLSSNCPHHY